MAEPQLNDRQRRFADGMLAGKSLKDAYIEAGYKATGASAEQAASRLSRNVKVERYLAEGRAKLEREGVVERNAIVRRLARIALAEMGELVDWTETGVAFVPSTELTPDQRALVVEVSETPGQFGSRIKIKRADPLRAIQQLIKIMGWDYDPNAEVDMGTFTPDELRRVVNGESPIAVLASRAG